MLKKRYYPIIAAVVFGMTLVLFSSNLSAETPPPKADIDIVLPGIETPKSHAIEVGESLILAGLPFPLHMLNGTELHLPEGSLEEDIRVEISLPDFSTVSENAPMEVGFGEMVANAIKMQVFVDGELVSPYYFAEPVELTLPVPNNLPAGIGEDVSQFILAYMDDEGEGIDTEEIKTVFRDEVNKFVRAEVGHFSNIVMTAQPEDSFVAEIDIPLPDQDNPQSHALKAGESLVLAGLPFPLHMLNGTKLHLPEGSLEEDIRVEISLPDFSTVSEEAPMEVGFGEMVANAIKVQVFVDGELVSPYYFAEPVELTLPIPNKLPAGIGEDVSQFILAYMDDEGEGIDTEEIKTVFRDEVNKFVRAEVGHFSNIVMTTTQELTPAEQDPALPAQVSLDQNYPNPFNPVTVIGFELPVQSDVRLEIVNILGQTVAVLEDGMMTAGAHQVSWDASAVPSGVYLYRLQVNNNQTLTRSMTLMK